MGLSRARVAGLVRRRGSIISWQHALPTNEATINPFTLEPFIALGADRVPTGPMGESYMAPVLIRAYLSNKISQVFVASFGVVEAGDYQLTLALPFTQFFCEDGQAAPPPGVEDDYNAGNFYVAPRGGTPRTDRFFIEEARFTVQAKPVPILDHNQVIAWRLLVKRDEY